MDTRHFLQLLSAAADALGDAAADLVVVAACAPAPVGVDAAMLHRAVECELLAVEALLARCE